MNCVSLDIKFSQSLYGDAVYVDTVGTRDELIESNLAADYMFDQLGDGNTRKGSTEYGDRFNLERRANGLFNLSLSLRTEAKHPYGMGKIDPYETDITDILNQIKEGVFACTPRSRV